MPLHRKVTAAPPCYRVRPTRDLSLERSGRRLAEDPVDKNGSGKVINFRTKNIKLLSQCIGQLKTKVKMETSHTLDNESCRPLKAPSSCFVCGRQNGRLVKIIPRRQKRTHVANLIKEYCGILVLEGVICRPCEETVLTIERKIDDFRSRIETTQRVICRKRRASDADQSKTDKDISNSKGTSPSVTRNTKAIKMTCFRPIQPKTESGKISDESAAQVLLPDHSYSATSVAGDQQSHWVTENVVLLAESDQCRVMKEIREENDSSVPGNERIIKIRRCDIISESDIML